MENKTLKNSKKRKEKKEAKINLKLNVIFLCLSKLSVTNCKHLFSIRNR